MNDKKDNKTSKASYIFTRETMGVTLIMFSAIIFVMLVTRESVFGAIGEGICTFMYGTFGYGSLFIVLLLAYFGVWLAFEKKIKVKLSIVLAVSATLLMLFCLFQAVTTRDFSLESFAGYLSSCYESAGKGWSGYTFGGAVSGLLVYPVASITSFVGTYIIFSLLTLLCGYITFFAFRRSVPVKSVKTAENKAQSGERREESDESDYDQSYYQPAPSPIPVYPSGGDHETDLFASDGQTVPAQPVFDNEPAQYDSEKQSEDESKFTQKNLGRKILFENDEFAAESYRRNMIFSEESYFNHPVVSNEDYLSNFSDGSKSSAPVKSYTDSYQEGIIGESAAETPSNYVYGEKPVENLFDTYRDRTDDRGENPKFGEESGNVRNNGEVNTEKYDKYIRGEEFSGLSGERPQEFPVETPGNTNDVERENRIFENTENLPSQRRTESDPSERSSSSASSIFASLFGGESMRGGRDTNEQRENVREERDSDLFGRDRSRGGDRGDSSSDERDTGLFGRDLSRNEDAREVRDDNLFGRDVGRKGDSGEARDDNLFGRAATRGEERGESGLNRGNENIFDDDNDDDMFGVADRGVDDGGADDERKPEFGSDDLKRGRDSGVASSVPGRNTVHEAPKPAPAPEPQEKEEKPKLKHVWKKYVRPTLDLLIDYPENNYTDTGEIRDTQQIIVETLEKFNIPCEPLNVVVGPAITRYDIKIMDLAFIDRPLKYKNAIAMSLRRDNINIYLNHAMGAVSIEIPNKKRTVVGLKTMLTSPEFLNSKPGSLTFGLGKNMDGKVICPDITKMPHLLVAGTTGSGKSICLSALLVSLLYNYGPEELRLILVDPKQVEFISFDKLPHLMINEIIYDIDKAIKALNWAIKEMERRYSLFKEMTENGIATKNLEEYNSHLAEGEEKLPKILIILDEFGDLMLQAKKDIENRIIKLVQKARACGIHLVLATQRPSVDCITGLIKSNLPTRIGFKVNSFADSSTIFDIGGAERLLGKGDMFFRSAENPELARIQGCFVDTPEVQKVTDFVKSHNETYFDQEAADFINKVEENDNSASFGGENADEAGDGKLDETYLKALKYCITANQASVSMIQRRFPIGYIKACKIIDWMSKMNYITQAEGSKPRKILLTMDEFVEKYGEIDD